MTPASLCARYGTLSWQVGLGLHFVAVTPQQECRCSPWSCFGHGRFEVKVSIRVLAHALSCSGCRSGCLCRVCDSCQRQTRHWETSLWGLGAAVAENPSEGGWGCRHRKQLCSGTVQGAAAGCGSPGWVAVLGSARAQGDSAQPAAGQLSHAQTLAMSSQGPQWEPEQLPKSCPGCLTRAC